MKISVRYILVVCSLSILQSTPIAGLAGGECGCYCGKWLDAPCSDSACKAACGWNDGGSSGRYSPAPQPDWAEQQQQREAELARQRREAAERRIKEEAAHQAQFIRERDAAAATLKGAGGSSTPLLKGANNTTAELKGAGRTADTKLKDTERGRPEVATAPAACPVGKAGGGTWCQSGMEWKCVKCGSLDCPVITGRKC